MSNIFDKLKKVKKIFDENDKKLSNIEKDVDDLRDKIIKLNERLDEMEYYNQGEELVMTLFDDEEDPIDYFPPIKKEEYSEN